MNVLVKARLIIFLASILGFIVGERYLKFESYHWYVVGGALGLAFLATLIPIFTWWKHRRDGREERQSWCLVSAWQLSVLLGAVGYLAYAQVLGTASGPETLATKALLAAWLLLFILGSFAGIGIEIAHANAGTGSMAEPKRVLRAGAAWLMVGMVLAGLICFNYAGSKRDKVYDWSYLKTTTPSAGTIALFKAVPDPIEVFIFYPQDNDVRSFVSEYFEYLEKNGANIKLNTYDKDLTPTLAEELKVSKNGQVLFKAGEKRERLDIGLELAGARQTLRKLDGEVQKLGLRLTSEKKKVYFTRGHGEFTWTGENKDPLRSIDLFETLLRSQNYSVHTLGMAEGSGSKIPDDAAAVVIVGPDTPFLQQEADALWAYLENGGRVAVFLDAMSSPRDTPELVKAGKDPLVAMLKKAGMVFEKKILANEKNYVSATRSQADRWFLFTNSFSTHESVTNLARSEERSALLLFQTGYFEVEPKADDWRATTIVRSVAETFADENRNFKFDEKAEKKQTFSLGVVASRPVNAADKDGKPVETDGKIVAFADANMLSDVLIRTRANALIVLDTFKWMTGQMDIAGEISNEEDIKIQHTNKEDAIWFNATVVVVPAFVLLIGFVATRKRKKAKG